MSLRLDSDYLFTTSCKLAEFSKNPCHPSDDEPHEDYAYLLILNLSPHLEKRMCENLYSYFQYFLKDYHQDYITDNGEISFDDYLIEFSSERDQNFYGGNGATITWLHMGNIVRKLVRFYLSNKD